MHMSVESFTDEQLINLVNNTIQSKTDFSADDFTGGSVQVSVTSSSQVIKHKVSLFFGYKNRNAVNFTFDIEQKLSSVWMQALMAKSISIKKNASGMDLSELNSLMGISSSNEVISKEVVSSSISSSLNEVVKPSYDKRTRATRLTEDCVLIIEWIEAALAIRPDWDRVKIQSVFDSFKDYWIAKSGKDATKLSWIATWRTWCRNERSAVNGVKIPNKGQMTDKQFMDWLNSGNQNERLT